MNDENNVKRVIPMIMLVFISSATMISVINIISPQLTVDFGISPTTVSLLSMTVMLMMGVASVAYSTLSDYLSIRRLMIFGVCLLDVGAVMGFLAAGRSFYMLLGASALMITGGTCGSGLMIILVSRYIGEREHARYYGFNTACVSISQASGTYLHMEGRAASETSGIRRAGWILRGWCCWWGSHSSYPCILIWGAWGICCCQWWCWRYFLSIYPRAGGRSSIWIFSGTGIM